ncbi:alpha/beta hydrolase [Nakamurella antarctica]|uniref:Alpha/beta hydrolase n=1 Tax=Nakamurella antarctica TaxID=1902245 RepID=A0A3G8ZI88_9ACTN|nr:alpha/beta hydrolase [Nakamurella antarctica]AZI57099.1 alpha/beta hydrolase [Nakamurella antarctica]
MSPHPIDVLGPGWSAQTLELAPDSEGPVTATLVRRESREGEQKTPSRRAVLYVHGYIDYFFQTHLGDAWADHGYDFYALDLRKYGRSLRAHQTPNYITDLAAYDEELDEAVRIIRADGHDVVVVMAHSTGGLIVPLWANRRRGPHQIDGIILNSPWFDLNGNRFEQTILTRIVNVIGRFRPKQIVSKLPSHYARSLHQSANGTWDFNLAWKPFNGFPVRAGWLRAIRKAHAELNAGISIDVPILVCASDASGNHRRASPELTHTDCVLNVQHMVDGAPRLGKDVTLVHIPGGIHDLALSALPVRTQFFDEVFAWAKTHLPDKPASTGNLDTGSLDTGSLDT